MFMDFSFGEIFEELAKCNDRSVLWNSFLDYVISINLMAPSSEPLSFNGLESDFHTLFRAWLVESNEKFDKFGYYDLLGEYYTRHVQSKSKASDLGQFYTPSSVSDLITELSLNVPDDRVLPVVNDCCCGSGRLLLSAHYKSKGDVFCLGQDVDSVSCKMAVLNFFIHGVRGSVLWMDVLEDKFFNGWRVNKYLYHGVSVPHIERVGLGECLDFFELYDFI